MQTPTTCNPFQHTITMSHVKVLFGTAAFGSLPTETSQEFLDLLKKYNVKDLDTARGYVS